MKIETKFNLEQEVWVMEKSLVKKCVVSSISTDSRLEHPDNNAKIPKEIVTRNCFFLRDSDFVVVTKGICTHDSFYEKQLFATKQELLDSL